MINKTQQAKKLGHDLSEYYFKRDNKEIINYNASLYFMPIIEESNALYLEWNISEQILGHTQKDNLGTSIMVNKKLNGARKNFTIAHEIGHLLLHVNELLPVETTNTISVKGNSLIEKEANAFAAHFLLPDNVLKYQIMSGYSMTAVSKSSGISKESIYWRIVNYLNEIIGLTTPEAVYIANEYKNTINNKDVFKTELYKTNDDFISKRVDYFYKERLRTNIPF